MTVATAAPRHAVYWRDTEPVQAGPPLAGDARCDVGIVGGGYTGMWAAHFLKEAEPDLDVQIVEAEYAGAGASGHNDGFVTPTIGHSMATLVRRLGVEGAKAAYASVGRSIVELHRFCRKHGVDADFEPNGFYLVAAKAAQIRRLEHDLRLAERLGVRGELLRGDAARARIGSPAIEAALKTGGALVNPHKLARGLARLLRHEGVAIHERTEATGVGRQGRLHVITTPHGCLTCERVVLATNAYQHRFAPFRRSVKPVWSYAMVSEPLSDEQLAAVRWPGREGFVEARNFILFARLTAENRLLLGGGPAPYFYGRDMGDRHLANASVERVLRGALARYFPPWHDLRFTHSYGGCIAVTRDLVPHLGELPGGIAYGYGYCGNGIAMTHTAGKVLRDLVLGRSSPYSNLKLANGRDQRFPPEPLAFLGARALSRTLAWQDRHPGLIRRQLV